MGDEQRHHQVNGVSSGSLGRCQMTVNGPLILVHCPQCVL